MENCVTDSSVRYMAVLLGRSCCRLQQGTLKYCVLKLFKRDVWFWTSLSEMAVIVDSPTITMASVSGGLLAWIRPGPGLLAESFHQGVGTWAACIFSRALVIDCDSLPVLYFTLTSWHAFLEKWMATGLNRVPLFRGIWLVRYLYVKCATLLPNAEAYQQ